MKLTTESIQFIKQHLPELDLTNVEFKVMYMDGPMNKGGSVRNSLWNASRTIQLDQSDVRVSGGYLDRSHSTTREIVLHELVHIMQGQRGLWYRIKMWFWNQTKKYNERPHEKEAYELSRELMATF